MQAESSIHQAADAALAYYAEGEVDVKTVIDRRQAWHEKRDQLAQSQLAWATSHVTLFKALGGGW